MFFRYFASYFASQLYPRAAAAAAAVFPPFPQVILLKLSWLSTATAVKDRSTGYPEQENRGLMSDFLLSECGLCQSELLHVLKLLPYLVRVGSTDCAQQAVRFLRDLGYTEQQVRKVILRNPSFLTLIAERQFKPKLEFMKTLGVTTEDFGNVISRCPRFVACNLEKTLCPNILYLQNRFGSEADISRFIKLAPRILHIRNGPEIFERRLKHLASFGLREDESKELVSSFPCVLSISIDKVQKIMEFFIHTVGLPAKFALAYPRVLNYSLERRIKPRYRVLMSLSAIQPSNSLPNIYTVVYSSDSVFLERYVKCSPHATKLLEIYSGKPVDLDFIQ